MSQRLPLLRTSQRERMNYREIVECESQREREWNELQKEYIEMLE